MSPPEGIGSPPWPSAGRVSWIERLAMPDSEKERTVAIVPRGSGA